MQRKDSKGAREFDVLTDLKRCVAVGCPNSSQKPADNIQLHRFPFDRPFLLWQWNKFVRVKYADWDDPCPRSSALCSLHFKKSCYDVYLSGPELKKDAIPTIQPGELVPKPSRSSKSLGDIDPKIAVKMLPPNLVNHVNIKAISNPSLTIVDIPSKCSRRCVALGCTSSKSANYSSEISHHLFPFTRPAILAEWIKFVKSTWKFWRGPYESSSLCSLHFTKDCYSTKYDKWMDSKRRKLKFDAIPTIQAAALASSTCTSQLAAANNSSVSALSASPKKRRHEYQDKSDKVAHRVRKVYFQFHIELACVCTQCQVYIGKYSYSLAVKMQKLVIYMYIKPLYI
jgi:hypothetical protein